MISIVVSTRKIDEKFKSMVLKTVGLKDVQLLIYENDGVNSLTEIYNKGLKEAKNDIVVFCHDDIELVSGWGKKLIEHYKTSDYGIMGVAGSREITNSGFWWSDRNKTYGKVNHTDGKKKWTSEYSRPLGNDIQEVVAVDGVFFSVIKSRLKTDFDESYRGFHFYDISFCLSNHLQGVKIGVHTNIILTHNSIGVTNEQWERNREQLVSEYGDVFPIVVPLNVTYRDNTIKLKIEPKLAVVIPTKNKVDELLIPCIESIVENTKYTNYTIYIADTGSDAEEKSKISDYITEKNKNSEIIKLIEYDYYNFAKINNDVVKNKIDDDTELVLFCNNDIELVNDAIAIMVDTHQKNKKVVGTVGCRLHYEDGTIQHMGIILQQNKDKHVDITHKFLGWDFKNALISTPETQTHGNTAAFMLISNKLFTDVGGFNEDYVECFEDVELNLACWLKNKKNLTNTNAVCYHFESQTRGKNISQEDVNLIFGFIERNPKIKNTYYQTNK